MDFGLDKGKKWPRDSGGSISIMLGWIDFRSTRRSPNQPPRNPECTIELVGEGCPALPAANKR